MAALDTLSASVSTVNLPYLLYWVISARELHFFNGLPYSALIRGLALFKKKIGAYCASWGQLIVSERYVTVKGSDGELQTSVSMHDFEDQAFRVILCNNNRNTSVISLNSISSVCGGQKFVRCGCS